MQGQRIAVMVHTERGSHRAEGCGLTGVAADLELLAFDAVRTGVIREEFQAGELGLIGDAINRGEGLIHLRLVGRDLRSVAIGARGVQGQVADATELGLDLIESLLTGFDHVDRILGVLVGDGQTGDLGAKGLADDEASGVVRRAVDSEARAEALNGLRHGGIVGLQPPMSTHGRDVLVDTQ